MSNIKSTIAANKKLGLSLAALAVGGFLIARVAKAPGPLVNVPINNHK